MEDKKGETKSLFQYIVISLLYLVGVFTMMLIGVEFVDWTMNIARLLVG